MDLQHLLALHNARMNGWMDGWDFFLIVESGVGYNGWEGLKPAKSDSTMNFFSVTMGMNQ
jgi:hypothetical protein